MMVPYSAIAFGVRTSASALVIDGMAAVFFFLGGNFGRASTVAGRGR